MESALQYCSDAAIKTIGTTPAGSECLAAFRPTKK